MSSLAGKSHALNLPNYQPGRHIPPARDYYSEISNEQILFIINKNTGFSPYSHDFVPSKSDTQILSGFVSAMASFMGHVTGFASNQWKTVYSPESTLLVEGEDWCVGVIAVARETSEIRSKLRRVIREFEDAFEIIKDSNEITMTLFQEFDNYVRRTFIFDRLTEHSILLKAEDWFEYCTDFDLPSIRFNVIRLLYYAQNGQSLGEIARQLGYSIDEVKNLISYAVWNRVVLVEYTPSQQEILATTERALCNLFDKSDPLNLSTEVKIVVGALDSRSRLSDIFNSNEPIDRRTVCAELGLLLNKGYLQRISTERKLVLVKECILSRLLDVSSEYLSKPYLRASLRETITNGLTKYPWLSRIRISDDLEVHCLFEDGMCPIDFDYLYNSLDYLIGSVKEMMLTRLRPSQFESLENQVEKRCHENWLPSFWEMML